MKNHINTKILDSIKDEMEVILKNELLLINKPSKDNPIEFENDLGKFKYLGDNNLAVEPKKGVEYLVINLNLNHEIKNIL